MTTYTTLITESSFLTSHIWDVDQKYALLIPSAVSLFLLIVVGKQKNNNTLK